MEAVEEKKQRGGRRDGAGRKPKDVKTVNFTITSDVVEILSAVKNRSQYVCDAVRAYNSFLAKSRDGK